MALTLSVLTLNIWGIPLVSKDKDIRVKHIAEKLAQSDLDIDIVSLQEVWSEYDYIKIKERVLLHFPYSHYFLSGVFGSGLCVFSRHKIISTFFHNFQINGYPHKIQHGDWFGGKGVGMCKLKINDHVINFYLTHLHAEYDKKCDDYKTHRVIQAFDTAQFLENSRGDCSLQILAGDLNTEPGDLAYRVFLSTSKMKDAYNQKPIENTGTHEFQHNTYSSPLVSAKKPEGIRIDYIFSRPKDNFECKIDEYKLPFIDKIPELNISYSDHEAVYAQFTISKKINFIQNGLASSEEKLLIRENIKNLKECITHLNTSLKELESKKQKYTMYAIGLGVLFINVVEINADYGLKTAFTILKFVLVGLTIFFIFMATLFNVMEYHAILGAKLSMEIALRNLETDSVV